MSNTNIHPPESYRRQIITTTGEVKQWLAEDAIGGTPLAASYLENMRSLLTYSEANARYPLTDELTNAVLGLAVVVGNKSEDRLSETARVNDGRLPVEIEGIAPFHNVQDDDIFRAAAEFDPTSPDYQGYVDGNSTIQAHAFIMDMVNRELGKPPIPQE